MKKGLVILFLGIFLIGFISAINYYVCYNANECNSGNSSGWSTGSSTNMGTSKSTPFQCPQQGLNAASAGDTVIVGDGDYSFSRCGTSNYILSLMYKNGAAGNYITVKSENKWGAVLDGEQYGDESADFSRYLVLAYSCSYIRIENFEIKNAMSGIWGNGINYNDRCHHVNIKGNYIHYMGFDMVTTQLFYHDWIIDSNLMHDNYDDLTYDGNHQCVHNHNMYIMGYNMLIQNNIMYNSYGGSVLSLGGWCSYDSVDPPGFLFGVKVINNNIDATGSCMETYQEPSETGGNLRYNQMDFWNRAFANCYSRTASDGGTAVPRNYKDITIENNLFLGGREGTAPPCNDPTQFIINTNAETVVCDPSCDHFPWKNSSCETTSSGSAGFIRINNNLAQNQSVSNPTHQNWIDEYNNNCDNCKTGLGIDYANHNYALTSNSVALINKGSSSQAPAYDILGNPRDSTPDVGAYEYLGTAPTCSQGQIISTCLCGGISYSTGYCCSGIWQSTACSSGTKLIEKTNLPNIDGVLSGSENFLFQFSNPSRSDNLVRVYSMWDDADLYFAFEVSDNSFDTSATGLWQDDGIEIYTDAENDKTTAMDADDGHFTINIDDVSDNANVVSSTQRGSGKYVIEVLIPWSEIGIAPSVNKEIGFLIGNNDRDSGVSVQFDHMNLIETGSYSRPYLWDTMRLVDSPSSSCSSADTNSDGTVSISELLSYISSWKSGSVTISQLLTAINQWKSGC